MNSCPRESYFVGLWWALGTCIFIRTPGDSGVGVQLPEKHSVQDIRDVFLIQEEESCNGVNPSELRLSQPDSVCPVLGHITEY